MVSIKNKEQIEKMREACKVANLAQKAVEAAIRPGISTWELDKIAERTMREYGAIPAEKGFPSGVKGVPAFPGSICASVNDVVIHGIPSKREILHDGDIISVDLVAYKNGFNGDCCRTYFVGNVSEEAKRLTEVRKNGIIPYLRPDGKTQVTVEYEEESPVRVDTIVISTHHEENVDLDVLKRDIKEEVINKYYYERNHDPMT